jgi:poly-gamma-glutamate capsule biosynthesis protein CapA/YwtB (metallophosphatase superfamily)
MYEAELGNLTVALAGDTIPTRPLSVFRAKRSLRIRETLSAADAAYTNLEAPVHTYLDAGQWQRPTGGTYMTTEPYLLDELKWLGFNLVSCGSSHADDYGSDGVLRTLSYFDAAGLAHAGLGRHLAEARSPAFLDTARGRVALVAAHVPDNDFGRAGEQRRDSPGFPGLNVIRHRVVHQIDRAAMDAIVGISMKLGWHAEMLRRGQLGEPDRDSGYQSYNFLGRQFEVSETTAIRSYTHPTDNERNLRQIAHAKGSADCVIASLHTHEQGGDTYRTADRRSGVEELAEFAVEYAHAAIDAGADIFVGHGPQAQLGIEIYKGRPIFYGLGAFIFQLETVRYLPEEAYERYGLDDDATPLDFSTTRYAGDTRGHPADPLQWEQAFFTCEFEGGRPSQVLIHPIELGFRKTRYHRGRPLTAEPEASERILARIAERSRRYGTKLTERDGQGLIEL